MGDGGRRLGESAMKAEDQDYVDDAEIVQRLRNLLGARLTAYIAGVEKTQIIRAWADGTETLSSEVSQRLRLAYRIAAEIAQHEGKEVTQTWFMGMNPLLDDFSPAHMLRESDAATVHSLVANAARSFIS